LIIHPSIHDAVTIIAFAFVTSIVIFRTRCKNTYQAVDIQPAKRMGALRLYFSTVDVFAYKNAWQSDEMIKQF
jgi:hypothetical protein